MSTNEKRAVKLNAVGAMELSVGGRNELVRSGGGEPPQGDEPRRYSQAGWRAGKPEEDPEKMKKWGLVTARPSEFLIHMRRGRVRDVSGQGASCFKLPGDAVAIVPTSVQRLQFTADQVTNEKVGVQVTGLAVYRIVDPLVAFRMLNFSFPERAQQKLAELLREMFVGAVRRLVANLSVEECLSKRKEGIATELMKEIAPVVSGKGRPEDRTDSGWGVVLDTIEIQDVRVLSETVFANMQARFREEQERVAREAELAKERFIQREEAEAERQTALTRLATEEEVRHKRQEAEEQAKLEALAVESRVEEARVAKERSTRQAQVSLERETALAKLNAELEVREQKAKAEEGQKLAQLEAERRMSEAKLAQERALAASKAQAELEKLKLEQQAQTAKLTNERALAAAKAQAELERLKLEQEAEAARLAHERQMAAVKAEAELEKLHQEQQAQTARHGAMMAVLQQEAERARAQAKVAEARCAIAEAELAMAEMDARKARITQDPELAKVRALKEIDNTLSPEAIQLVLAQQLPQVAAAFQQKMGEVHVTAVDGANPFGYIAAAVEGVMGLARSAGLQVPAVKKDQAV
ncbi:MAG TPA: SPFH domain-containing protein [Archangium sp.]|uniref:SPFH domain-containing protein n=1 Tax=Archangium sp. TaxID=1872627 RepID=UPI002E34ED2E|nr:SPFH domain-containing protein [Archangium sp.]HEX5746962.1 SPFH domain-containing protein [Archangium sp.]